MMRSIYMVMKIHISKTYIDAEFDVESDGMVYLASKGCLNKVICEKHTFLNVPLPSRARVSPWEGQYLGLAVR